MGLPEMERKPLKLHSRLCKCKPRCEHYIYIEEIGRLCNTQAMNFAVQIINLVKGTNITNGTYSNDWTTSQEKMLKKWVEGGVKNGDYRIIGEIIGKSRSAVKSKVQHMTKEGKIKTKGAHTK